MSAKIDPALIKNLHDLSAQNLSRKQIAEKMGKTLTWVNKWWVRPVKKYNTCNNRFCSRDGADAGECNARIKALKDELGIKDTLVARQATPEELAEFGGIKPIQSNAIVYGNDIFSLQRFR